MTELDGERRGDDRIGVRRPCKVFESRSGKYWLGETVNVSPHGALLRLDRPLDMQSGDHLFVGIADTRRQPILRRGDMLAADVRHTLLTSDDQTFVGIRFPAERLAIPPAVARHAA